MRPKMRRNKLYELFHDCFNRIPTNVIAHSNPPHKPPTQTPTT